MTQKHQEKHPAHIKDVMTASPHTIGSNQKLSKGHEVMNRDKLRHLPVLRSGKLVGVVTQRDLYFLQSMAGVDIDIDVVADAMTPDVFTTTPDATLRDVVAEMMEHKYGCAVVMEDDRVVGIFTMTDALRVLRSLLD